MSKIYISPETFKKLSELNNYSEILNHFDVNRPEPKHTIQDKNHKPQFTKQYSNKTESEKELRRSLKQLKRKLRKVRHRHHINLQKANNKSKKHTTKPLMGDITERRLPRNIGQPATFSYSINPNKNINNNYLRVKTPKKKTVINSSYLKEHHLLAEGYTASKTTDLKRRYAEIKSKNNAILNNCRKARKNRRKRDWTDRFALK